jgi:hypothetical protein
MSGAEMIATKIMYAGGYNVPENYIGYLRPELCGVRSGTEPRRVTSL